MIFGWQHQAIHWINSSDFQNKNIVWHLFWHVVAVVTQWTMRHTMRKAYSSLSNANIPYAQFSSTHFPFSDLFKLKSLLSLLSSQTYYIKKSSEKCPIKTNFGIPSHTLSIPILCVTIIELLFFNSLQRIDCNWMCLCGGREWEERVMR